ncbi:MAG: hypothetical protein ACRDST_21665 [Pseudonocardiaceae bacterium]
MTALHGGDPSFDRDAVLEAAARLFWQHGDEAIRCQPDPRDGHRPPSLYTAFGDKKTPFAEVVDAYGRGPGAFAGRVLDTIAGSSASSAAASRRTPPTVVGNTGTEVSPRQYELVGPTTVTTLVMIL